MKKVKSFLEKDIDLSILVGLTAAVLLIAAFVFGSSMYSARNIQSMAFQIPARRRTISARRAASSAPSMKRA